MYLSEKKLLDNYKYSTIAGEYCSRINGKNVYFTYRNQNNAACSRRSADKITVDIGLSQVSLTMGKQSNHKLIKKGQVE